MYVPRWGPKHTAIDSPGNIPQKMSQGVFGHIHTYIEVLHTQKGNHKQTQKVGQRPKTGQIRAKCTPQHPWYPGGCIF